MSQAAPSDAIVASAAEILLAAEETRTTCPQLTSRWPALDVATAYAIQEETLRRRLARGEQLVGIKLGLTSKAKQVQMNVSTPTLAWLTSAMCLDEGILPAGVAGHPRAEPEIVFTMGHGLKGPGVTAQAALSAVAEVRAGIELLDSRYANFRFTLADVVADNASSRGFVLGSTVLVPSALDLAAEACVLQVNGQAVAEATGSAVLGNPAQALAWAANALAERGHAIEAGWVVMTGGLTDAVQVPPGAEITASFARLGTVTIRRPA